MIEISNLRKYTSGQVTRLEADIKFTDMVSPYSEKTIWFEIDKKYSHMLSDESYDTFILVPLYLAMYHKQDLYIRGCISKKFYQNIKWYIQKIFCYFDPDLSPISVIVDGFTSPSRKTGELVGTGISCGVDSLSTIYDHFISETDPDYKINSLFFFSYEKDANDWIQKYSEGYFATLNICRAAADELGLPLYLITSNLLTLVGKNFHWAKVLYIINYSCALSIGSKLSRFYIANSYSYEEFKNSSHPLDMSLFCELYLVPLLQTEQTEFIIDGCQYLRVDKIKKIIDWDITRKFLTVCLTPKSDGSNCSDCGKCMGTMFTLEMLGKLKEYNGVFDIEQYQKKSFKYKTKLLLEPDKEQFAIELIDFARENNFPMPVKKSCYILDGQAYFFDEK